MNILYHFRTRGIGAEAVHIAGIAKAFEKFGHRVIFSSPTGIDPRQTAALSTYRADGKATTLAVLSRFCPSILFELLELGYNLPAYWRNRQIVKSIPIGMIYERHAFFLASTAWLARRCGVPLVVEVNELVGDARVRKQPLLSFMVRCLDRMLFRQATLIVVVSPHLKRRIEALGISGDKILVLPNAVDEEEYARQADGGAMRQRLGLEDNIVVGFVGWFAAWHRLDFLLDVFALLAASRPALRLVLVGEGPEKGALQGQIRRLGMADQVVFTGELPHHEIPDAIAAMDVCVVPHSNEYRSPIKLFEYMGQGRLVVAPSTEPVMMIIRNGENGLLFKTGDCHSLGVALARGVDDATFRDRVGGQARRDVLSRHTWRENAAQVLEKVRAACEPQKGQ